METNVRETSLSEKENEGIEAVLTNDVEVNEGVNLDTIDNTSTTFERQCNSFSEVEKVVVEDDNSSENKQTTISDNKSADVDNSFEAQREVLSQNPYFLSRYILDDVSDDKEINLKDVWFVRSVDAEGEVHIEPYIMMNNSRIGECVACLNEGWIYKLGAGEAFGGVGGYVSAKRWQAMDLETLVVKEELVDSSSENKSNEKQAYKYNIEVDCVASGKSKTMFVIPAAKEVMRDIKHECYRKFLGKACYKIYDEQVKLDYTYKDVRELAKEYERRANSVYEVKEATEFTGPAKKYDLIQSGRVNLDNLWFVTRLIDGKFEVLPCVENGNKKLFVDVSTGNIYNMDENGGFSNVEGFVNARRWRAMELNCLKVSEYYKDMSKEGAAYLERGIFEIEIGSHPYHLYSLSISGVMTKGTSEFSSANAPVVDFKEFRDKNIKHNLGKVLLNVLDPKFNSVSNVGEVCIYAREFADRLNSRSHPKLKGSSWLGDDINSSSDMMKRKKGSTDGFFARIKRYFSNRKRLRDANETYGDEKQKDFS